MDNAAFHIKAALRKIIERTKHKIIFLPSYSPNLNPIEKYWSYLKKRLREIIGKFSCFYEALNYILSL